MAKLNLHDWEDISYDGWNIKCRRCGQTTKSCSALCPVDEKKEETTMLTPEERAALERLRKEPYEYPVEWLEDDRAIAAKIALRDHPADEQQPVDWPTSPGKWWIETQSGAVLLGDFDGDMFVINEFPYSREACRQVFYCRFLPAHIPTFPPREPN